MVFLMKKELLEPAARGKKPVLSIFGLIDRRCWLRRLPYEYKLFLAPSRRTLYVSPTYTAKYITDAERIRRRALWPNCAAILSRLRRRECATLECAADAHVSPQPSAAKSKHSEAKFATSPTVNHAAWERGHSGHLSRISLLCLVRRRC